MNTVPETASHWWLAEMSDYGYASNLLDGPHSEEKGAHHAAYLLNRLGLTRGRKFVVVQVFEHPCKPDPTGANEEALEACNTMAALAAEKEEA